MTHEYCRAGNDHIVLAQPAHDTAFYSLPQSVPGLTCLIGVQVTGGMPEDTPTFPELPEVQGHQLLGGPQMLQLR